jgi:hypothetical protein
VCSTAVTPILAPRRLGSAAMASVVSAAAPGSQSGGRRPRACSAGRCRAACSAAYRRRESTERATAPLRGRPAIGVTPPPGTSGNGGCGRNCKRSAYGGTPRSRSARHARRAPPCGSARSRSLPSADRGSHGRGWPRAKRDRGRGGCPRPPEPVEPQSPAIAPPAPRCVASEACGAAGSGGRAGSRSWR